MDTAVRRVVLGLLAAVACLAISAPAFAAGAPGDTCPTDPSGVNMAPSCFEGADGDVTDSLTNTALFDWQTLDSDAPEPSATVSADGTGLTDMIFMGGSKEQDPTTWALVEQSSPDKDDLLAAASYIDTVMDIDGAHVFFYGAFERLSNNGDANLSFELNKVKATFDNDADATTPEVPVRTEGDLLITYDGNSSNGITIGACAWHGDETGEGAGSEFGWYPIALYVDTDPVTPGIQPDPADKIDSNDFCTELDPLTTPAAIGAMNATTLTGADQYLSTFSSSIEQDNFGELAVDLTEVFKLAGGAPACLDFGALFLHSRASETPTSSMKDYVEPQPLKPADDCDFEVNKLVGVNAQDPKSDTTPATPVEAHVGDTLNYDVLVTNTGVVTLALNAVDPACDGTLTRVADESGDGDADFEPGETWKYQCAHVLVQGDIGGPFWDAANNQFVNEVSVTGSAEGFESTKSDQAHAEVQGKVIVDKVVTGAFSDADLDFGFTPSAQLSGGGAFPLSASDPAKDLGYVSPNVNQPGTVYTVTEGTAPGYTLDFVDCDDSDSTGSAGDRTATIKVSAGETVTCTFSNSRDTGTIEVVKDLQPSNDPGLFDLFIEGEHDAGVSDVGDGGTTGAVEVPTGDYSIGEAAGTGTSLDDYVSITDCDDPVTVSKGDEIVCTITNLRKPELTVDKVVAGDNASGAQKFDFTLDGEDASDFQLAGNDPVHTQVLVPNATYTLDEVDPKPLGYKLSGVSCTQKISDDQVELLKLAEVDGEQTFTADPGDEISCTYTNTKINEIIRVQKTGPAIAYSGDTLTFGFLVTNPGNEPLTEVKVTDDKCPNVTGPTSKEGGNQDDVLDPGEAWTYTCSYVITHNQGDVNPVTNTATATGKGPDGNDVTSTDKHDTQVLHPKVAIDKTGPATAQAGSLITYTLNITNPGDVSFAAQLVVVSDALCQAPPALQGKNGDGSPATFDPGDRWTYTCQVQTQVGQTSVDNVGRVEGTDANGRKVNASDNAVTTLSQPAQQVEPQPVIRPGSARLRGPTGCPTATAVKASVTGRRIVRVTFYVDGRKSRTVTKADAQGRWSITLRPKRLAYGQHAVRARIEFASDSGTQPRNLRLSFNRCRPAVAEPKFTG